MNTRTLRGARHHLCIDFLQDGERCRFYPTTDDPEDLARRFAKLIRVFLEHPSAIHCAAGHHPDERTT